MLVTEMIDRFGGVRELMRLLGCPITSVNNCIIRGRISFGMQQKMLTVAQENGIQVTPEEFFALERRPLEKGKKATKKRKRK